MLMSKVFLAYSHVNHAEASHLRDELRASGYDVWWDQMILPGQDSKYEIRRAIRHSCACLLCLSKEALGKHKSGLYPEAYDAITRYREYKPGEVYIIPVRFSACEIPPIEIDGTRTLDRLQYVDLFPSTKRDKRDVAIKRLLASLNEADRASEIPELEDTPCIDMSDVNNVAVAITTVDIEVTIDGELDNFSKEDQNKLLRAFAEFLKIGNIKIKKKRLGSIKLTLELTPSHAEKLLRAIKSGQFDEHRVLDAELKESWHPAKDISNLSYPTPTDLVDMIAIPAQEEPERVALYLCHHGTEPENIRWGDLWREALAVAARLQQDGLGTGQRVLLILPTSRAFVTGFFGIILAGGIPVPAAQPSLLKGQSLLAYQDLLHNIADDSGAAFCISRTRLLQVLHEGLSQVNPQIRFLDAEALEPATAACTIVAPDPDETAFLQYTSGSTSRPKGVMLTHQNILANLKSIKTFLYHPHAVALSGLPLYHYMGLIGSLLTSLYARTPVVLMPPKAFFKNPARWLRGISDYRATITMAPNFAFRYCVRAIDLEEIADIRLDCLRIALNGAEPVDPVAVQRFEEKFESIGLRKGTVCPVYGLAESTLAVTFSEPGPLVLDTVNADRIEQDGEAVQAGPADRSRTLVSVGRAVPGQQVRVVDEAGHTLPERQVGEILVKGASVMKEYYRHTEETNEALRDGWLYTGDLGYQAEGQLYIAGRRKDLIIRHGRNYHPEDIEFQVTRIAGISKRSAVAFSVEREGETKVVVVAETRLRDAETLAKMKRSMREQVHHAFLFGPDVVRFVKQGQIPRTSNGKVQRQESKRRYLNNEF